jgi:hypothetical protein
MWTSKHPRALQGKVLPTARFELSVWLRCFAAIIFGQLHCILEDCYSFLHFLNSSTELEFISIFVAGIPKGQYKGYTCPQCQKTKVSAQHHRQKEKKKRTGTSVQEKGINGKGLQPSVPDSGPKPSSVVKKQPIINPQGLLEAILADCSADPSNFHPLKNSFKKLLQIQRSFKVRRAFPLLSYGCSGLVFAYFLHSAERGGCIGSILEAFRLEVNIAPGLPASCMHAQMNARWAKYACPVHSVAPHYATVAPLGPP